MDEGTLDLSIPMVYKAQHTPSNVVQFREWIEFTKDSQYGRHGAIGLGPFLNSLENTLVQVDESRAPSAAGALPRGLNFFSYQTTNVAIPSTPVRPRDEFFRALTEDGAYAPIAPFPGTAPIPEMSWKTQPRAGHLLVHILDVDDNPADGALVTMERQPRDSPTCPSCSSRTATATSAAWTSGPASTGWTSRPRAATAR